MQKLRLGLAPLQLEPQRDELLYIYVCIYTHIYTHLLNGPAATDLLLQQLRLGLAPLELKTQRDELLLVAVELGAGRGAAGYHIELERIGNGVFA